MTNTLLASAPAVAMMMRYSFGHAAEADLIEQAVQNVLNAGVRTGDIAAPGEKTVGTKGMGEAVTAELDRLNA